MPQSASARIAEKLAQKEAKKSGTPVAVEDPEEEMETEDIGAEATPVQPEKKTKMSVADRAAAARAARANKPKVVEADEADDDEADEADEDEEVEEPTPIRSNRKPKLPVAGQKGTGPGRKAPSPAQVAAREAFAARSRAAAAAKKGKIGTAEAKPVQTQAEIRQSQRAKRDAERAQAQAEADAKNGVKRQGTSKAQTVVKPKKPTKVVASQARSAPAKAGGPTTQAGKDLAAKATKGNAASVKARGDLKTKVHALLDKGKTRAQIMEALDLSYASVFYHSKSYAGAVSSTRGKIFVKTPWNEDGEKLGKGKTEEVSRSEHMRRQYLSGMEVGDVARDNDVRYQIAYTAIRSLLGEAEE